MGRNGQERKGKRAHRQGGCTRSTLARLRSGNLVSGGLGVFQFSFRLNVWASSMGHTTPGPNDLEISKSAGCPLS